MKTNAHAIFDALLILQYKTGDNKAIELLVKRHQKKLLKQAFWYVQDKQIAKDIVQESWSVILRKLYQLKDPNQFRSWAMKITTRNALDFLRKQKIDLEKRKALQPIVTNNTDPTKREEQIIRLRKAIRELPQNAQEVLRLFYIEEYSLTEIGEILNIAVGTVKSRLFHAREKLKKIIK